MSSLLEACKAGAGVLLVPSFVCETDIKIGNLKRVLNEWYNIGLPVNLVSPVSIASTARLKLVSEELIATIKKALYN